MIDITTGERLVVSTEGTAGPYIMIPIGQLEKVQTSLDENNVPYWVDVNAISIDGKPAITVVNLGRNANAEMVQAILDSLS